MAKKIAANVSVVETPEPQVAPGVPFHIEGRRWFQKSYGNTYHTAYIYQGGTCLVKLGPTCGYGDQFLLQTAFVWLYAHGLPQPPEHWHGGTQYGTQYLREVLRSTYSVADVAREKDL